MLDRRRSPDVGTVPIGRDEVVAQFPSGGQHHEEHVASRCRTRPGGTRVVGRVAPTEVSGLPFVEVGDGQPLSSTAHPVAADPNGKRTSTRAVLFAAAGQNRWPPAGGYMVATGQDLMAADRGLIRRMWRDETARQQPHPLAA